MNKDHYTEGYKERVEDVKPVYSYKCPNCHYVGKFPNRLDVKVEIKCYRCHSIYRALLPDEEIKNSIPEDRNGSPIFYELLERMAKVHDSKSHDYASNTDPFGNYHFAGQLSKLFNNPDDAGFVGRIGEKLYRLANLENSGKIAVNESVEDTELDICVIITLWMADRRDRRNKKIEMVRKIKNQMNSGDWSGSLPSDKTPKP